MGVPYIAPEMLERIIPGAAAKRLLLNLGPYSLDVTVAADADLDGQFEATCNDTGDRLLINGWMIDDIEQVKGLQ